MSTKHVVQGCSPRDSSRQCRWMSTYSRTCCYDATGGNCNADASRVANPQPEKQSLAETVGGSVTNTPNATTSTGVMGSTPPQRASGGLSCCPDSTLPMHLAVATAQPQPAFRPTASIVAPPRLAIACSGTKQAAL